MTKKIDADLHEIGSIAEIVLKRVVGEIAPEATLHSREVLYEPNGWNVGTVSLTAAVHSSVFGTATAHFRVTVARMLFLQERGSSFSVWHTGKPELTWTTKPARPADAPPIPGTPKLENVEIRTPFLQLFINPTGEMTGEIKVIPGGPNDDYLTQHVCVATTTYEPNVVLLTIGFVDFATYVEAQRRAHLFVQALNALWVMPTVRPSTLGGPLADPVKALLTLMPRKRRP